jgi:hypothetical protein
VREVQTQPQERPSIESVAAAFSQKKEIPVVSQAFKDKIDAKSHDDEEMIAIQLIGALDSVEVAHTQLMNMDQQSNQPAFTNDVRDAL